MTPTRINQPCNIEGRERGLGHGRCATRSRFGAPLLATAVLGLRRVGLRRLGMTLLGIPLLTACSDDAAEPVDVPMEMVDAGAMPPASGEMDAGDDVVGFAEDIYPILSANCAGIACHGNDSFLPQHANSDIEIAYEEAFPVAELIAGRVAGELTPVMPQGCGPGPGQGTCLSFEQVALIREWFDQGAPP